MEKVTNQESAQVSREQAIEELKRNLKDLTALRRFLDGRAAEIISSDGNLALNIEVAEVYRDAGLLESAKEAFTQAAEQAWQEQDNSLHEQLAAEADKIQF